MIHITIKGFIESVESDGRFANICIRQKNHPSDKFNVSASNKMVDLKNIRKGFVIDCDCNLAGNFPYNNIYVNYCSTAKTFKELDIDNEEEYDN